MDVRMYTVGPVQENCFIVRAHEDAEEAVIVDPGDEAGVLLQAIDDMGVLLKAILLTHTHFDHVGAVAPVARETGAPVYCPKLETFILADIQRFTPPYPGLGPFESYEADETVEGGETLELAGMTFDVRFVPGHSPGHVAYSVAEYQALFSGDVIFQSSIGRTDLPGGDHETLMRSIASLLDEFPDETRIFPGHMGLTTLGRERRANPFLQELAR